MINRFFPFSLVPMLDKMSIPQRPLTLLFWLTFHVPSGQKFLLSSRSFSGPFVVPGDCLPFFSGAHSDRLFCRVPPFFVPRTFLVLVHRENEDFFCACLGILSFATVFFFLAIGVLPPPPSQLLSPRKDQPVARLPGV